MLTLNGLTAVFLFSFGTASAAAAFVQGNNIAALLAIAGLVGSGLFVIADMLGRSYQPAIYPAGREATKMERTEK